MEQLHAKFLVHIQFFNALTSASNFTALQECKGGQMGAFNFEFNVPLLRRGVKRNEFRTFE